MRPGPCLGWRCGAGHERGASLKDMKVLIGQWGKREVYAKAQRLWNGQAFLAFSPLCASANQKTAKGQDNRQCVMVSSFPVVFCSGII